jgi:5-methylcytosine-specific restriction endonuclease McrA
MSRKKIPDYVRGQVLINQEYFCNHCDTKLEVTCDGIPLYDIDHIEMHADTKNDDLSNLQALCLPCHRIKSVREIRQRRKKYKFVADVHSKEIVSLTNKKPNPFDKFKFDTKSLVSPSNKTAKS